MENGQPIDALGIFMSIMTYKDVKSRILAYYIDLNNRFVSAGIQYSAGVNEDGTVSLAGKYDQLATVKNWTGISTLDAGDEFLAGLTTDGRVV